ncbi:Hsp70 family protein [Dactylosporangium cerinum]|uniref:Hsp70 family protein n=1 Tax=Dactylosporangium cerinum TaxID=1434730 RepID=A0ABV9WC24_9ACTN
MSAQLAIDYGTSNTVALLRWPEGRVQPILFDSSPLLSSAVYAEVDGRLLTGRDATRAARLDPARFEPNPKRRVDDTDVLLGDTTVAVVDLIAATLRRVNDEAVRALGQRPQTIVVTHPVAWGPARRSVLTDACEAAGLGRVDLVPESVAAATNFAVADGGKVDDGQVVVVYDLGAGTFDASVVRRTGDGFETLAYRGVDDLGGLDLDALVVAHAGAAVTADEAGAWRAVTEPTDTDGQRQHRLLWDDAREAKETLSRQPSTAFHIGALRRDVLLTRTEFESAARPLLAQTVAVTEATIRESRSPVERIAGVFLVGGGSRIPLVATMLHQAIGVAPVLLEQPELVVAQGALSTVTPRGDAAPVRSGAAVAAPSAIPAADRLVPLSPAAAAAPVAASVTAPVAAPAGGDEDWSASEAADAGDPDWPEDPAPLRAPEPAARRTPSQRTAPRVTPRMPARPAAPTGPAPDRASRIRWFAFPAFSFLVALVCFTQEVKYGAIVLGIPTLPTLIAAAIGAWRDERRGVATPPWVQALVIFLTGVTVSPLLLAAAPVTLIVVVVWQVRKRRRAAP